MEQITIVNNPPVQKSKAQCWTRALTIAGGVAVALQLIAVILGAVLPIPVREDGIDMFFRVLPLFFGYFTTLFIAVHIPIPAVFTLINGIRKKNSGYRTTAIVGFILSGVFIVVSVFLYFIGFMVIAMMIEGVIH